MKYLFSFLLILTCLVSHANEPIPYTGRELSAFEKDVIEYFKEIALGFEYGNVKEVTRRWERPMRIFLDGVPHESVRKELGVVVDELNELITTDFEIQIVTDLKDANLHLFVGTIEGYTAIYPQDYALAKPNSGIFTVSWNTHNEIVKGRIFIKNDVSLVEQRHAIREELTQCLGLGKDSVMFQESVFQLHYTTPTKYAEIDKAIIRLLYHPKMKGGLSGSEVEPLLTDILMTESLGI